MTAPVRDGRSSRWDPHRRERREAIISAAIRAVEQYGPDALTAQIAQEAGVPRTHVYRHFDGKPALDLAVSRQVATELGERLRAGLSIEGSPRQIISASIEGHLSWIEAHPNLYRFLAQHSYAVAATGEPAVDDAKAVFATELTALLQHYLRLLDADPAPAEQVAVGVVGMVDATAAWWLERREVPRPELTAALTDQVWVVIEAMTRALGLALDPDAALPTTRD
jgi:AcrR family transcriptional regulator